MSLSDFQTLLKEVGVERVAKIVSFVAWLFLPFWGWRILLQSADKRLFVLVWAFPGFAVLAMLIVFYATQATFMKIHEFRLMKMIEHVDENELLKEGPHPEKVASLKKEYWKKLILPFAYHYQLMISGIGGRRKFSSLFYSTNELIIAVESYSIITFYYVYEPSFQAFFSSVSSLVYSYFPRQPVELIVSNEWTLFVLLWLLSLYYDPFVRNLRNADRLSISRRRGMVIYAISLWDMPTRILSFVGELFSAPGAMLERYRAAILHPFVSTVDLPDIVQTTVMNTEGKSCNIVIFRHEIASLSELNQMKKAAVKDKKYPLLLRLMARTSDSDLLLDLIRKSQPIITYIGTHSDECVFLGLTMYDPIRRIRVGRFHFATRYLKRQFMLIYKEDAKKQRVIGRGLPLQLLDLTKGFSEPDE